MKHILAVTLSACIATINASADRLWDEFVTPPDDCRTKLWWFHGETETTKEGIDADLKAFKEKGVGGVVFCDQIHGKAAGAAESMSDEWWESLKYAAMKARETGLSFEVAASNGYVAGGPWITPELSMKKTVFIDTLVTVTHAGPVTIDMPYGGKHFRDIATVMFPDNEEYRPLAFPGGKLTVTSNDTTVCFTPDKVTEVNGISYTITPRGKGSTGSMNIPGKPQERYLGAKYMEYPPVGQLEYSTDGRTWLAAADGLINVTGGMSYKAIIVQDRTHISPQAESKLRQLSAQGATVIWCNKGEAPETTLAKAAIAPDIHIASDNLPHSKVLFFHRTAPDEEIYFVYNHSDSAYSKESRVRARFKTLEYWRPATLERETIATDDNGTFSLNLSPYESTFIIARRR